MHDIVNAFLSVCLSVKCMHCDKVKEMCAHILIPWQVWFILLADEYGLCR